MSLFHASFQKLSPLQERTESLGSMKPFSRPIREEMILNVEQGERWRLASSGLKIIVLPAVGL